MKKDFRSLVLFPILLLGTMTGSWSSRNGSGRFGCTLAAAATTTNTTATAVVASLQQEEENKATTIIATSMNEWNMADTRQYPSCCELVCPRQTNSSSSSKDVDQESKEQGVHRNIRGRRQQVSNPNNATVTEQQDGRRCVVDCSPCTASERREMVLTHENTQNPKTQGVNDLGIRFNKFGFLPGTQQPAYWRILTARDYPIRGYTANVLKNDTSAVSVVTEDDYQFIHDCHRTAHEYIMACGGYPTMPDRDPNHPYWSEFEEVVDWQIKRRGNVNPNTLFRLPNLWQKMNVAQVAEAVHNEYPGKLQAEFTEWLLSPSSQQNVKLDQALFPFRSQRDFLGTVVRSAFLNSWAVAEVGPISFYAKWAVGRPRPEEIAWKISRNELTSSDGVSPRLAQKIKDMKLTSPESFTHYPEGSPQHPAWPAMHSAGSTSSFWLRIIFNLNEEQYCQALLTDYAVAMARTVSGVHYRMDNIGGLNMGQEIIAERLADFLAEKYGSDRNVVQAKIDKERFNWENFDPETCARW